MNATAADLGATIRQALAIRDRMKADGATADALIDGLARTLRAAWPQRRAWHYLCEACDDYGLSMRACSGDDLATCGRQHPHAGHEYGVPCSCVTGARFTSRPTAPDDYTQATKTSQKATKPTRLWR